MQKDYVGGGVGGFCDATYNPPASEAIREVANLTERKNLHTPVDGVKEFVRLSTVCLSVRITPPLFNSLSVCVSL